MIYLEDARPLPPRLAAKLAQGESAIGELRNALTALVAIRADLGGAIDWRTGIEQAANHARNDLAGVSSAIERALKQLEAR